MPSDLQRQTARGNGAKSRGPVTPDGKRRSSMNRLRHGFLAADVVIDSESLPRFRSLLVSLEAEFAPRTAAEYALVETMAVTRWRQMRLWALEKSALDDEIRRQELDTANKDAPTRALLAFRGICDQSRSLELINRYETRFDRQFLRLVCHFERFRDRREAPDLDRNAPRTEPTTPQNIEISVRSQEDIENNDAA